jgi:hypothetical protein
MIVLNNGNKLKQEQTQFRCPKSNYVSETREFTIKTQMVKKSFRKTYTKGIISNDDKVLPHRV